MTEEETVEKTSLKRSAPAADENVAPEAEGVVGPDKAAGEEFVEEVNPEEDVTAKRAKLVNEEMQVYLENLPSCDFYEKSYMHREPLVHVVVSSTDFIITASVDGHVKFWKKMTDSIEFVKHFRAHLGRISDASCSNCGTMYCTVADDKTVKVYDVTNFDMCNMLNLEFVPSLCQWIFRSGDAANALAVTEKDSHRIFVFDGKGEKTPLQVLDSIHRKPVCCIAYNPVYETVMTGDVGGMFEYWTGPKYFYEFPPSAKFKYKTDSDLYEFAKNKTHCTSISVSNSGKMFATIAMDRKVRIFKFLTGKLHRELDESVKAVTESQQEHDYLSNMEFGKRLAVEKDLQKNEFFYRSNSVFDESDNFLLYPTMIGVKVVHIKTGGCVRFIGQPESIRLLSITLYQGCPNKSSAAVTMDMKASSNPALDMMHNDPCIFACGFKQKRFFIFSNRDPHKKDTDRDVFNEKPTKEEQVSSAVSKSNQLADKAVLHTVLGDIHIQLFGDKCPKTVENFSVHARNGYFNNHIFHRVIKSFMIQTGDPTGSGSGGESIWGHDFEDEIDPSLRHDKAFTVSMANSGPCSNGSQFFITVVPTPWLDNKHTVFGRVFKGLDVVKMISEAKVNPRTEKPYEDIKIVSVSTS